MPPLPPWTTSARGAAGELSPGPQAHGWLLPRRAVSLAPRLEARGERVAWGRLKGMVPYSWIHFTVLSLCLSYNEQLRLVKKYEAYYSLFNFNFVGHQPV